MSNNLNLNHKNYKPVPTRFIKKFKLGKYFRHTNNEGLVVLTSIEFKFVPEKVSKINKRLRTLETKSPLFLKVRLKKIWNIMQKKYFDLNLKLEKEKI